MVSIVVANVVWDIKREKSPKNAKRGAKNIKAAISTLLNMQLKKMETHPKNKLDFNYITDGIYIGTNQCCQTHFDENLVKDGVRADISLEEERIDAPFGVEFYVWIPVKNHEAPTKDQLEFGVSVLEKIIAMQKKVYVHCKNGHGRAPTLIAALLIKKGKTTDEAIELIKSRRPSIHLTDAQKESLKMWERNLRV